MKQQIKTYTFSTVDILHSSRLGLRLW